MSIYVVSNNSLKMLNKSLLTNNYHSFDHYCTTTKTIIV